MHGYAIVEGVSFKSPIFFFPYLGATTFFTSAEWRRRARGGQRQWSEDRGDEKGKRFLVSHLHNTTAVLRITFAHL